MLSYSMQKEAHASCQMQRKREIANDSRNYADNPRAQCNHFIACKSGESGDGQRSTIGNYKWIPFSERARKGKRLRSQEKTWSNSKIQRIKDQATNSKEYSPALASARTRRRGRRSSASWRRRRFARRTGKDIYFFPSYVHMRK